MTKGGDLNRQKTRRGTLCDICLDRQDSVLVKVKYVGWRAVEASGTLERVDGRKCCAIQASVERYQGKSRRHSGKCAIQVR